MTRLAFLLSLMVVTQPDPPPAAKLRQLETELADTRRQLNELICRGRGAGCGDAGYARAKAPLIWNQSGLLQTDPCFCAAGPCYEMKWVDICQLTPELNFR